MRLIQGTEDALGSVTAEEILAEMPEATGAELRWLEGRGHWPFLEDLAGFAAALDEELAEMGAAEPAGSR